MEHVQSLTKPWIMNACFCVFQRFQSLGQIRPLYRLSYLETVSVPDCFCKGCYVREHNQSLRYTWVIDVNADMSRNVFSLWFTHEWRLYMLMCLGTLSVSELHMSDDCTGWCVWERFQSLIYTWETTIQADVSGNVFSLWFNHSWRLRRLLRLGKLSVPDLPVNDDCYGW